MTERNAIQRAYDLFGESAGFEKKSGSWYHRSNDVISVSNLQRSQYGPQYYINQAFWLRELGDEPYPKSHQAHIFGRIEDLFPALESRIENLLDLEYHIPDDQRVDGIVTILNEHLRPLIERGGSLAGLREMANDGTFAGAGINGPAQGKLGITTK